MRIVALTYGTEGDTRPMVALCHALRDAGHDVTLLAERSGAERVLAVVMEALEGRRALLHFGWSGFGDAALPRSVRSIGHVPRAPLASRRRCSRTSA